MSLAGKLTPLQLNGLSSLIQNQPVITRSPAMNQWVGLWDEGTPDNTYTQGTLGPQIAASIKTVSGRVDPMTPDIDQATYANLISLGSTTVPALGLSKPSTFVPSYDGGYLGGWSSNLGTWTFDKITISDIEDYNEYFSDGFTGILARQAYYESWLSGNNQNNSYTQAFFTLKSFRDHRNQLINSFNETQQFLLGSYSNINDLTAADIPGVSLAFKAFGRDLINLGKTLRLSDVEKWGLPSVLLLQLQRNNALTDSLKFSLINDNLTPEQAQQILNESITPTFDQERKIYNAFTTIRGTSLREILTTVNCQTPNLSALSDLLDLRRALPGSYSTLTVPNYSSETASSKIYDFIYVGDGINSRIKDYSYYIGNSIPSDNAIAWAAFAYSVRQIKNIINVDFEQWAQVVFHLEVTNLELILINTETGVPGDLTLAQQALAILALGSGRGGTYRMIDFFGAASGIGYVDLFPEINSLIEQLTTPRLSGYYATLNSDAETILNDDLQDLIDDINAEIATIASNNSSAVARLNFLWGILGTQISAEQSTIPRSIVDLTAIYENTDLVTNSDIFIRSLDNWASETDYGESAQVLESMFNGDTVGGQSLIAALRESRNAQRLGTVGITLDNDVDDAENTTCVTIAVTVTNGTITSARAVNPGTGFDATRPPKIYCLNYPNVVLEPVITTIGSSDPLLGGFQTIGGVITDITVVNGGSGITQRPIFAAICPPQPQRLGNNPEPGNFSSSPYQEQISTPLVSASDTSFTPQEAIDDVIICNCECWLPREQ